MPTYLTPGVYVEEVPSANKPIEGVSTSIAAFVGLAPGGPVTRPMRISNWTQFAKIYGDPNEPDNGPFMEGAYLAHSVYASSRTAAASAGSSASATTPAPMEAAAQPVRRCRPPATRPSRPTARSRWTPAVTTSRSRSSAEPVAGEGAEQSFTVKVSAGSDSEEFTGLSLKKGRNNLATKVNAQSKLIKIEETGASLPEAARIPAAGSLQRCRRRRSTRRRSSRRTSRATSLAAAAWVAWRPSTRSRWS